MSPLVKRLEADGFVERTLRFDDERTLSTTLTERGAYLREREEALTEPTTMAARLGREDAELRQLNELMSRLIAAVDRVADA
ncbi:MAG: hypothetical protein ACQEWM_10750 [Actinomycetota bacterium]